MITSKSTFGMAVIFLALGVVSAGGGLMTDGHFWSILGGGLFGAGIAFLIVEIRDDRGDG